MRKLSCTAIFLCATASAVLSAADFESANQLYDEGRFGEAKQQYEQLVSSGKSTANVFHNLGNTDYRLGSPGRAMLNYERALRLEHAHPEAKANLSLLRERSGARLPERSWSDRLILALSVNTYAITGAVAFWIGVTLLVLRRVRRISSGAAWLGVSCAALIVAYAGLAIWRFEREHSVAIVTAKEALARLAPADRAALAERLPAGSRVRVLSERGAWIYCELPGKGRGWIASGSVERIRPEKA